MAQRAAKLRTIISKTRKTSDATQKAFLKAENALGSIEDREARRIERGPVARRPG